MYNSLYLNGLKKIAVFTFSALLLSGCSFFAQESDGDIVNTIDQGNIQGNDASRLIVWGLFETNENLEPLFNRFESNLQSENGIDIDVVYTQKNKDNYSQELDTVLNDGNPNTSPDIFMIHSSWLKKYSDKISNIPEGTLSPSDIRNDFHPFLEGMLVENNQVKGVPLWIDFLSMVYNRSHLIQDAGATTISGDWNQFLVQAQNMTKYDETNKITRAGFSAGNTENVEFSTEILDALFLQARNRPIDTANLNIPYTSSEIEQIQEVVDWYKSFMNGNTKTWSSDFKLDTALFIEGKLSSIILPSWRILDILNYKEEYKLGLDFGVSTLPQLNESADNPAYYPTFWIFVVSSDSQNSNNSFKLLQFITTEVEQNFYINTVKENGRDFAMLSPRKTIAQIQSNESVYLKPYYDSIANAQYWNMPDGEAVKSEYEKLIEGETTLEQLLNYINNLNDQEN